jgi:hypothetical protein
VLETTFHSPGSHAVSWLDWAPDPGRTFRAHDPKLEPYASMTKQQILEAMLEARSGAEWDFLQEFYLDKCSKAELAVSRETFLREQFGTLEDDLFWFLFCNAGHATRLAAGEPGN